MKLAEVMRDRIDIELTNFKDGVDEDVLKGIIADSEVPRTNPDVIRWFSVRLLLKGIYLDVVNNWLYPFSETSLLSSVWGYAVRTNKIYAKFEDNNGINYREYDYRADPPSNNDRSPFRENEQVLSKSEMQEAISRHDFIDATYLLDKAERIKL